MQMVLGVHAAHVLRMRSPTMFTRALFCSPVCEEAYVLCRSTWHPPGSTRPNNLAWVNCAQAWSDATDLKAILHCLNRPLRPQGL